jgi:hypothetical protein
LEGEGTRLSRYAINVGKIRGKRNAASSQAGYSGDPAPYHPPGMEKKRIFDVTEQEIEAALS